MAKIFTSQMHRNENASIEFGASIVSAVRRVRQTMPALVKSRKADEYAPGAVHALRKLCEGEGVNSHIHRLEVEEWRESFLRWFQRVKSRFPAKHAKSFLANGDEDFRILLECSNKMPEFLWRGDINKRYSLLEFSSQERMKSAYNAAKTKHPVQLGSALHVYLDRCIAKLLNEPLNDADDRLDDSSESDDALGVRLMLCDGVLSLTVSDFGCLDNEDDLEQDIVVTAYDLETATQSYLRKRTSKAISSLDYASESSMFCVYSPNAQAIGAVAQALATFVADPALFAKHRQS